MGLIESVTPGFWMFDANARSVTAGYEYFDLVC
jgi:hypothetical protein